MNFGVLDIQGDVSEHISMLKMAINKMHIDGKVLSIKTREDLDKISGIIIPGGESTTLYNISKRKGIYDRIIELVNDGKLNVMGTCAGAILISKNTNDPKVIGMRLMDFDVYRNAYGRQYNSFETYIDIEGMNEKYHAIFIRAPKISRVGNNIKVLGTYNNDPVIITDGKNMAMTFHPELSGNTKIHEFFIDKLRV
ncbi:MAG: pyridoxal 5'-phosphate synthase glutaminase subunit PdxT [Thermoplasmata archaeon]